MKTPHRAISLCCHETFDGRMTEHNHTPSTKAGQLSRHSCNQIPRGRYQQKLNKTGPGHQTGQTAGGGEQKGQRRKTNERRTTRQNQQGPPKHNEECNRPRKECECTCHVYGQTHKNTEKQDKHQKMRRTSAPVTSTDRYTG